MQNTSAIDQYQITDLSDNAIEMVGGGVVFLAIFAPAFVKGVIAGVAVGTTIVTAVIATRD